jgi:CRP/FNR family transcriptional regulator, cyclic AMP receptor protein
MAGFLIRGRSSRKGRRTVACVPFPAGTKLFDREHPCRKIYLLRSGRVQLWSDHEAILDLLARGDSVGEKYLLASHRVHQVAKTLSPTKAIVFPKAEFFERLRRDPRFARQIVKNLALRLDRYEDTIRDFVTQPAEQRLARALLRLAPSRPASGWVRLPWDPTNPELAKIVGTTRWRVSHFLNRFQQLGWLRRQEGLWVQREGLQAYLQPLPRPPSAHITSA